MKKLLLSILIILVACLICSCTPTPKGYYVVKYVIDGEELYSFYAKPDDIIGLPDLEEREGLVFKGWYLTDEYIEKWDFEYDTVKGSFTLYGYWVNPDEETFNILYYEDDELINYERVSNGGLATEYSPTDKKGYEFSGWLHRGNKFSFETPITDDIILTAERTAITYFVKFIADGEIVAVLNYTIENTEIEIPDVPQNEHYTAKWSEFKLNFEDIEVHAVYTPILYMAKFEADGKIIEEIKYTIEDSVAIPDVPHKDGYSGEWLGLPVVGGDITITAEYTPITYTITYKALGEIVGTIGYTVETIANIVPPAVPKKQGFSGVWEDKQITFGDVTVNAVYTIQVYTATFVADGKVIGTSTFQFDDMHVDEPEIPEKEGYTAEWEPYTLGYEDITIKAVYTPVLYTAEFFIDGEKIGSSDFTVEDTALTFPDIKEWQGYSVGWEKVEISANNLTINAILTPITYFVTFLADGIEILKVEYTVENNNISVPQAPQKDGFSVKWENFVLTYGNITVNALYTPLLDFEDEFNYKTESDGSLTVTGYYGEEKYLYVPSTHNGKQVKSIGKLAFSGSDISGVSIAEGIEIIEAEAFLNCKSLTEVILQDSLKTISESAFAFCRFTEINIPDNVFEIGSQAFAFSGIKEIVLPKNLSELKNIFYGCTSLTSITIPSNIELIEADAFAETTLESAIFEDTENWRIYSSSGIEIQNIDYTLLADAKIAADWLTRIHISRVWKNTTQD